MPFASDKQRKFLFKNKPDVARQIAHGNLGMYLVSGGQTPGGNFQKQFEGTAINAGQKEAQKLAQMHMRTPYPRKKGIQQGGKYFDVPAEQSGTDRWYQSALYDKVGDTSLHEASIEAANELGIDPNDFAAAMIQEGWNPKEFNNAERAYNPHYGELDSFHAIGLDAAGENEDVFEKYYGRKPNVRYYKQMNEQYQRVTPGAYKSPKEMLKTAAAVYKDRQDALDNASKEMGIELTPEQKKYFGYMGYNTQHNKLGDDPTKTLKHNLKYFKDKGMLDKKGKDWDAAVESFAEKPKGFGVDLARHNAYNAYRRHQNLGQSFVEKPKAPEVSLEQQAPQVQTDMTPQPQKPRAILGAAIGLGANLIGTAIGASKARKEQRKAEREEKELRMMQAEDQRELEEQMDRQHSQAVLSQYNPQGNQQMYFQTGGTMKPYPYQNQPRRMVNPTLQYRGGGYSHGGAMDSLGQYAAHPFGYHGLSHGGILDAFGEKVEYPIDKAGVPSYQHGGKTLLNIVQDGDVNRMWGAQGYNSPTNIHANNPANVRRHRDNMDKTYYRGGGTLLHKVQAGNPSAYWPANRVHTDNNPANVGTWRGNMNPSYEQSSYQQGGALDVQNPTYLKNRLGGPEQQRLATDVLPSAGGYEGNIAQARDHYMPYGDPSAELISQTEAYNRAEGTALNPGQYFNQTYRNPSVRESNVRRTEDYTGQVGAYQTGGLLDTLGSTTDDEYYAAMQMGGQVPGGELEQISDNAMAVEGNDPSQVDGVDIGNAMVDDGEMIKDIPGEQGQRVFSDTLKPPGSKTTFSEEAKKLEKQKNPEFPEQNERIEQKLDELFQMQQVMNGDSQGEMPAEAAAGGMDPMEAQAMGAQGQQAFKKGGIHIKPENRGKFTASAKAAGRGVQEHARAVLADRGASATQKKRANFARNAAGWNKQLGGIIGSIGEAMSGNVGQGIASGITGLAQGIPTGMALGSQQTTAGKLGVAAQGMSQMLPYLSQMGQKEEMQMGGMYQQGGYNPQSLMAIVIEKPAPQAKLEDLQSYGGRKSGIYKQTVSPRRENAMLGREHRKHHDPSEKTSRSERTRTKPDMKSMLASRGDSAQKHRKRSFRYGGRLMQSIPLNRKSLTLSLMR